MAAAWTLDELLAEAAIVLGGIAQDSQRVRDIPDERTARYYTTLGLLDGPKQFRGKVGLYGERQLLQLVAIKRLQARGETLAAIQARLLGLSTARLRTIADQTPPAPPASPVAAPAPSGRLQGAPIGGGVIVMLPAVRALTEDDLAAIGAASAPLLRLLRARQLVEDR